MAQCGRRMPLLKRRSLQRPGPPCTACHRHRADSAAALRGPAGAGMGSAGCGGVPKAHARVCMSSVCCENSKARLLASVSTSFILGWPHEPSSSSTFCGSRPPLHRLAPLRLPTRRAARHAEAAEEGFGCAAVHAAGLSSQRAVMLASGLGQQTHSSGALEVQGAHMDAGQQVALPDLQRRLVGLQQPVRADQLLLLAQAQRALVLRTRLYSQVRGLWSWARLRAQIRCCCWRRLSLILCTGASSGWGPDVRLRGSGSLPCAQRAGLRRVLAAWQLAGLRGSQPG